MLMVTRAMSLVLPWCICLILTTTIAFHLYVTNKGSTPPRTFLPPFTSNPIHHYYATGTTSEPPLDPTKSNSFDDLQEANTKTLAAHFHMVVQPKFELSLPETDPVPQSSTVLESNLVPVDYDPVACWPHLPVPPKITKNKTVFFLKLVHFCI